MSSFEATKFGVAKIGEQGRAADAVGPTAPPVGAPAPSHIAASAYAIGPVAIRAASVRGIQHVYTQDPRQDAYGIAATQDQATVLAVVCDGVGSLTHSHEAARLAAADFPALAIALGDRQQALLQVNERLAALAATRADASRPGVRSMATTLMSVQVTCLPGRFRVELGWVGDSEAWLLDDAGSWTRLAPVGGSDSEPGNATRGPAAIPAGSPALQTRAIELTSGRVFIMSDGVATPLAMNADVKRTLAEWWKEPPNAFEFAAQVGFARQSFVDDRTTVGLWLQAAPTAGSPTTSVPTVADSRATRLYGTTYGASEPADPAAHRSPVWFPVSLADGQPTF